MKGLATLDGNARWGCFVAAAQRAILRDMLEFIMIPAVERMVFTIRLKVRRVQHHGASCRVTLKLGPRYDMGDKLPSEQEGWKFALGGDDFGIWEKN